MKFLIALSIFQSVLLGFLGVRVLEIDAQTDKIAAAAPTAAMLAHITQSKTKPHPTGPATIPGPTAGEIRKIIREEVAAIVTRGPASLNQIAANKPDTRLNTDSRALKASIRQDLNYHIGRGKISEVEMAGLQIKIAQLPADQRSEMLSRLTKAMNTGDLDGRF